ncbi:3-oxoacyl-[acyl-carrier-protein] reductase FabG-like [Plutella xylostella]|uniref:3-oxoacyl-[acyl-carrier-protein] reductase FabG-like n=1 Tax=Plutella xylostella TaxID=51655 RepID=UPI002032F8AA|nr:3-oxoacyl-[acyl-carrier-protein] reductase FabG-like [Plutella xylostella]
MSINDKVVIVTGASSGIGASIAVESAKLGAKVVMVGRNEEKLSKVSSDCASVGKKVQPLVINADVSKDEDVRRIIDTTVQQFGQIDVLINNAGFNKLVTIHDEKAMDAFDAVLATNLRGVVHLTHLAIPYLKKTKGNIVNVSSVAAVKPMGQTFWAYCTSKAALDHFSKCMARELAPDVRVNVVNPGPVATDFGANSGMPADLKLEIKDMVVLERISQSEEVTDIVLFLMSDRARGVTGSCFLTDNGLLLK